MGIKIDWKVAGKPMVVMVVTAGVCYGGLWGGIRYCRFQENELKRHERSVSDPADKYAAAQRGAEEIATFYSRFKEYQSLGVIGVEDRVSWGEGLSLSARGHHLLNMNYSITQPEVYSLRSFGKMREAHLYASLMSVDMGLLHEEEMLDLVDSLGGEVSGLFRVRECHLERKGGVLDLSGDVVNFNGRCQLLWFNIKSNDGRWEREPAE